MRREERGRRGERLEKSQKTSGRKMKREEDGKERESKKKERFGWVGASSDPSFCLTPRPFSM